MWNLPFRRPVDFGTQSSSEAMSNSVSTFSAGRRARSARTALLPELQAQIAGDDFLRVER